MQRICMTIDDLARVRMESGSRPLLEGVLAVGCFGRRLGGPYEEWRGAVRERLGSRLHAIERVLEQYRPIPDLLWLAGATPVQSALTPPAVRHDRGAATAAVYAFHRAAVEPYWRSLAGYLHREREIRARLLMANGVESLLATIHPQLCWNPPYLEIPHPTDTRIRLNGRGLILMPSVFLAGDVQPMILKVDGAAMVVLIYSLPMTGALSALLRGEPGGSELALAALLGHTRAAAVQVISDTCSTGELAVRLGISLAGASKHATILRQAGLVTTVRKGNSGLHTLTSLGMSLLHGQARARPAGALTAV